MGDTAVVGEQMAVDWDTASTADGRNGLELPPERQRRKRPRPRRKRKLGKILKARRALTASDRAQQVRHQMFAHGQPVAPYNTTQFLIEDHGDLENIDAQLKNAPGNRHSRTRDSSFSIDSEDDYFYSSPEDEEEFLTKEFSLEYQDLHVERLNSLSKADIIHDYLLLEGKYEKSMGELRKIRGEEPSKVTDSGRDTDASSRSDQDTNEQLKLTLIENRRLKAEIEKLKRENAQLISHRCHDDSASSVDSECDSSSGSSISSSSRDSTPSKSPVGPSIKSLSPSHAQQTDEVSAVDISMANIVDVPQPPSVEVMATQESENNPTPLPEDITSNVPPENI